MIYLTGLPALAVPCKLKSCGLWDIPKRYFTDPSMFVQKESSESPFKDWGIEENKMVPYREFCTFNVANHVRAYVDMLYEGRFEELKDMFFEAINDSECRKDIFMLVHGKLRGLPEYPAIEMFMKEEFGNAWLSYLQSVVAVTEHISKAKKDKEDLLKLQDLYSGGVLHSDKNWHKDLMGAVPESTKKTVLS